MASSYSDGEISFNEQRASGVSETGHNDELQNERPSMNDIRQSCDLGNKSGHVQFRLNRESTPSRDVRHNAANDDSRRTRFDSTRDDNSARRFEQQFSCGDSVSHNRMSTFNNMNIKPDTYNGTYDFESYLSHFEDCAELSMWDARTKVLMLASSLRDSARTFYISLSHQERRDYHVLTERLAARFGDYGKHQQLWLNKFDARRREKNESIASLAYDLRHLARNAYVDLDINAQEHLALNQLYKLISTDMKCRCIYQNCTNIVEAVSVIERYESIIGTPHMNIRACDVGNDIESTFQQILRRLDQLESGKRQHKKACYGCNSTRHLWASCHLNKRNQSTEQRNVINDVIN